MTLNAPIDDDCSGFGVYPSLSRGCCVVNADYFPEELTHAMHNQEVKCFPV
mgnify:CR=1 FL=1